MGQYHAILNLTRRERFSPWDVVDGIKLMEFGQSGSGAMAALVLLLASEAWAGDRIAILGDYGEPTDLPAHVIAETGLDGTAYHSSEPSDIGPRVADLLAARGLATVEFGVTRTEIRNGREYVTDFPRRQIIDSTAPGGAEIVLANLDTTEYLDPAAFGSARDVLTVAREGGEGGVTTALAVLLAAACRGGARGGGDIYSGSPMVGSWAGAHLIAVPYASVPQGWGDISADLRDVLSEADEGGYLVADDGTVTKIGPSWARPLRMPA